jgi:hypothetical protein
VPGYDVEVIKHKSLSHFEMKVSQASIEAVPIPNGADLLTFADFAECRGRAVAKLGNNPILEMGVKRPGVLAIGEDVADDDYLAP